MTNSTPITRPFVYGSYAALLSKTDVPSDPSHTHIWTIYVRGVDGEDISYFVDRVEIKLHESFKSPKRTFTKPPYEVTETGWGQFEIVITVYFKDATEMPVTLYHMLQLFHKDGTASKTPVISEKYDEFLFYNPGVDLRDALMAQPLESLDRPNKHSKFNAEFEQQQTKKLQDAHEKVLADYEIRKLDIARLEEELHQLQQEIRELAQ